MIRRLFRRLFRVQYQYNSPVDRHRASVLLPMNLTVGIMILLWLVYAITSAATSGEQLTAGAIWGPVISLVISFFVHISIQHGRLKRAVLGFVGTLLLSGIVLTIFFNFQQPLINGTMMITLAVPTVAAGLLLDRQRLLLVVLVLAAALTIGAISQSNDLSTPRIEMAKEVAFDLPIIVATLSTLLIFLTIFAGNANQIADESVLHIQQRQWVAELGIELGKAALAESVILARALTVIHDRFAYSFAQVYLFDEDENVLKRTMNTGLGQQDLQHRGNLNLTETNAISEAARTRQIVMVSSGSLGSGYLRSASRYGIAVPIFYNQNLIGVLDIQTSSDEPHSPTELETLRLLAGQLGAGLMNARRLNELDHGVKEQITINSRLQDQLTEFQRREQLRVSNVWGSYLQGRGKTAIGFDLLPESGLTPVAAHDLPDDVRAALELGNLHIETRPDEKIIHVPIRFRNQMLGAMIFNLPATHDLTNRQIEMAQVVSDRLAVALENMRLFEQSQAQAVRERKAGQLANQLIEAKDVNALLNLAAESFNEVLGAVRTEIYLQPDFLAEPLYAPSGEDAN